MDAKIEFAKSWFVLAQMSITFAGVLIAASGLFITIASQSLTSAGQDSLSGATLDRNLALDKINLNRTQFAEYEYSYNRSREILSIYPNVTSSFVDAGKSSINMAENYFKLGLIFFVFAAISFMIGKHKLKKLIPK